MPLPTPEQERAAILAFMVFGVLALIGAASLLAAVLFALRAWVFG